MAAFPPAAYCEMLATEQKVSDAMGLKGDRYPSDQGFSFVSASDPDSNRSVKEAVSIVSVVRDSLSAPYRGQMASIQHAVIAHLIRQSCREWDACTNLVGYDVPCSGSAAISRTHHELASFAIDVANGSPVPMSCVLGLPHEVPLVGGTGDFDARAFQLSQRDASRRAHQASTASCIRYCLKWNAIFH